MARDWTYINIYIDRSGDAAQKIFLGDGHGTRKRALDNIERDSENEFIGMLELILDDDSDEFRSIVLTPLRTQYTDDHCAVDPFTAVKKENGNVEITYVI